MTDTVLPVHPVTGVTALAVLRGRPVWPVLGASTDAEDDDVEIGDPADGDGDDADSGAASGEGDDAEGGEDPDGADQLGDAGKKALSSMKDKWKSERQKRREAEAELGKLRKGAQSGQGQDGSDGQPDADTIRQEAEQAATAKANARIIRSEVRAAAAGKLNDPKDALTFLDLDQFEVDENGEVDSDEVSDAIEDLVKNKPYLAATAKRFQGTGDNGAARKAGRPKQLTATEVKQMTPEQIVKAQNEGRLDDYLSSES